MVQDIREYSLKKMESDRAQANLGDAIDDELEVDKQEKPKQPRRRFIGRKAAAERAELNGGSNGTIEDSGAIQGISTPCSSVFGYTDIVISGTFEKNCEDLEPGTSGNPT